MENIFARVADMKQQKKIENMTFEEAMAELETLVRASESGKVPLDDMLKYLERGNQLAAFCRGKLGELERRIEILTGGKNGSPEWSEFDPEPSSREI